MKSLSVFTFYFLCLLQPLISNAAIHDTIPAKIKYYTKEQFLKEFGKDETSEKMIGFYFQEHKKAKRRIYVFSGLTLLGIIYGIVQLSDKTSGLGFLIGVAVLLYTVGFLYGIIESIINRRKYSPEGLYKKLMDYQVGNPLSKKLKRQLKYFKKS